MSTGAERLDALDVALGIAAALEDAGLPYAIGGALAYGLWGVPRATVDVDINVFVPPADLPRVFTALGRAGALPDVPAATAAAERDGMFSVDLHGMRVDVFVPSIPFSDEAGRTRVRRRVSDRDAWFLSAEAIAVFKLLFFRGKDRVDLERLPPVMGDRLDASYVRRQVADMLGDDDERVRFWDEVVAASMRG